MNPRGTLLETNIYAQSLGSDTVFRRLTAPSSLLGTLDTILCYKRSLKFTFRNESLNNFVSNLLCMNINAVGTGLLVTI